MGLRRKMLLLILKIDGKLQLYVHQTNLPLFEAWCSSIRGFFLMNSKAVLAANFFAVLLLVASAELILECPKQNVARRRDYLNLATQSLCT